MRVNSASTMLPSGRWPHRLRVLTYHQVAEPDSLRMAADPRVISATPAVFQRQMHYVASHYHVVPIETVLETIVGGRPLPPRAVLITFDDAYSDFVANVLPTLQRFRLPATVFVPTAYPGDPKRSFWWDRIYLAILRTTERDLRDTPLGNLSLATPTARNHAIRNLQNYGSRQPHGETLAMTDKICLSLDSAPISQERVLDWDQLRFIASKGITLGAHTRTHVPLDGIPLAQAREEIVDSQRDLAREIGRVLPIFCYPNGNHDAAVIRVLREEGFIAAFTTITGHNDLCIDDSLRLRRQNVTRRTSPLVLKLRLTRWGNALDSWRHGADKGMNQ